MSKRQVDIEFEKWIAWAERTNAFPNLVSELKTRTNETGRAEAVTFLKALRSVRRRSPTVNISVLLVILTIVSIAVISGIGG
jgi:hypothetical protein